MDCKKIEKFIISYIYDELPQRIKIKLEDHFTICENCKTILKDYKMILVMEKEREIMTPSALLDRSILTIARQELQSKKKLVSSKNPAKSFYPSWALAAVFMAVAVLIWNISPMFYNTKPQLNTASKLQSDRIKTDVNKHIIIREPLNRTPDNQLKDAQVTEQKSNLTEAQPDTVQAKNKDSDSEYTYTKHPIDPYYDSFDSRGIPSGADFASFQHRKGLVLKNKGNCYDANNIFESIIKEYPWYNGIKKVYIDSADCYAKMGDKNTALNQLQTMVQKFPQDQDEIDKLISELQGQ
jgi:hypothetical protein